MDDLLAMWDRIGHPRILVLGDAMLDRYTWGKAERVSPEAPVVVLRTDHREVRLGGAASVAVLLKALEAEVTLAAVIGDDHDGRTIQRLIDETRIDASPLLVDPGRPTTTKDRFLGGADRSRPHQILRVDTESRAPLDPEFAEPFIRSLATLIPQHAAVLISDYAKGVCTESILAAVIARCRETNVPVLVDPARGADFAIYRGATLLKPNRLEAELAIGHPIQTPREALAAATEFRERYDVATVVITLDRDGLVFATSEGSEYVPIVTQEICDITGAGDTILAILGLAHHLTRSPIHEALTSSAHLRGQRIRASTETIPFAKIAAWSNPAAGIQVARSGVTPISRADLFYELTVNDRTLSNNQFASKSHSKIVSLETAQGLADKYHREGRKIVFTNGCFDLLHVGHVATLEEAARQGDLLFVGLNSDASVRSLKGPERPIVSELQRARMLAALECVHRVVIFPEETPCRLLEAIRPDILVKGGTTCQIVGQDFVENYGGAVLRVDAVPGNSTTELIERARQPAARLNTLTATDQQSQQALAAVNQSTED